MSSSRTCLQEISINTLAQKKASAKLSKKFDIGLSISQHSPTAPKKRQTSVIRSAPKNHLLPLSGIDMLPVELLNVIFTYLKTEEILTKAQIINKSWYTVIQNPYLWKTLEKICPVPFEHKYVKQKKVVERRSKGKLYIAKNRLTGETHMVRKVILEVTNAGKDDGIPTSILREISFLSSLDSTKIGTVTEAQVKGGLLFLSYPYQKCNLKEYMKGFIEGQESCSGPKTPEKAGRYKIPMGKIKVNQCSV